MELEKSGKRNGLGFMTQRHKDREVCDASFKQQHLFRPKSVLITVLVHLALFQDINIKMSLTCFLIPNLCVKLK